MDALILAAGIGRRLKPLSYVIPKPLLRVGDRTIIEHLIEWLLANNISSIKIILSDFGKLVESYLSLKYKELQFIYSKPLGTAGQLSVVKGIIKNTFVICYSDIIVKFDLKEMIEFHKANKSVFTIATYPLTFPLRFGVITHNKQGKVTRWDEKPSISFKVNAGVFIAEPITLNYVEEGKIYQMNELVINLLKSKLPVFSYTLKGEYYDLGTLEDYERVNKIFEEQLGSI